MILEKETDNTYVFKKDDNLYVVNKGTDTPDEALAKLLQNNTVQELSYKMLREREYIKQGLTPENFALAMIQKELDNDSQMLDEYNTKRQEIKVLYPKSS